MRSSPPRSPRRSFDAFLGRFTYGGRVSGEVGLLITLAVVASVVSAVLARSGIDIGLLNPEGVLYGQAWRLVTWAFVASSPIGLMFSCLALYWFGRDLVGIWGTRRFLVLFVGLAALTGALTCLVALAAPSLRGAHFDGLASVLSGFIVAWGFTYRDRPVQFFGAVPMTGSSVAWITIALVFLQMAWSWERGVPDVIALALASAYVFRDRLRPDRGRTSRASPKRPSHVRAVRDDERWN